MITSEFNKTYETQIGDTVYTIISEVTPPRLRPRSPPQTASRNGGRPSRSWHRDISSAVSRSFEQTM